MTEIKIKLLSDSATMPTRAHETDAGLDLYASESKWIVGPSIVKTGIAVEVPKGYVGKIESRSSMASKGLYVTGGIIDHGYSGEVRIVLNNYNDAPYVVNEGDKIAQLVLYPIATPVAVKVDSLDVAERGENGFGSSGH